jgi:hypothetical protein
MQGTIYKLYATSDKYYYYGSTTQDSYNRYLTHMSTGFTNYKQQPFGKLYNYMQTTNMDDWVLEEIEYCPISILKEREAYYVNNSLTDPYCLNQNAIHVPYYIKVPKQKYKKQIEYVLLKSQSNLQEAINSILNINQSADNHLPSADTLPTSLSANSQSIPSATSSATRRYKSADS